MEYLPSEINDIIRDYSIFKPKSKKELQMKYAYGTEDIRHCVINISSRRTSVKKYKS